MVKKIIIALLFTGLLFFGILIVAGIGFLRYSTEAKPTQPIAFSHNIHIEQVGLECDHCHQFTEQSPRAGIPGVEVCAECHEDVAADREEIKKLMAYRDKKEPIPWNIVHHSGWHVYFTHKRHIKANIDCSSCHGEIKAMSTVRKVRSLEMGWCVTCHKENNAPTDCLICHK